MLMAHADLLLQAQHAPGLCAVAQSLDASRAEGALAGSVDKEIVSRLVTRSMEKVRPAHTTACAALLQCVVVVVAVVVIVIVVVACEHPTDCFVCRLRRRHVRSKRFSVWVIFIASACRRSTLLRLAPWTHLPPLALLIPAHGPLELLTREVVAVETTMAVAVAAAAVRQRVCIHPLVGARQLAVPQRTHPSLAVPRLAHLSPARMLSHPALAATAPAPAPPPMLPPPPPPLRVVHCCGDRDDPP